MGRQVAGPGLRGSATQPSSGGSRTEGSRGLRGSHGENPGARGGPGGGPKGPGPGGPVDSGGSHQGGGRTGCGSRARPRRPGQQAVLGPGAVEGPVGLGASGRPRGSGLPEPRRAPTPESGRSSGGPGGPAGTVGSPAGSWRSPHAPKGDSRRPALRGNAAAEPAPGLASLSGRASAQTRVSSRRGQPRA